jgi:hypothetical protein
MCLPARVAGFDHFDAFDRIAASELKEGIAAPFGPLFKAAKWPAPGVVRFVLTPPTPDCKYRRD